MSLFNWTQLQDVSQNVKIWSVFVVWDQKEVQQRPRFQWKDSSQETIQKPWARKVVSWLLYEDFGIYNLNVFGNDFSVNVPKEESRAEEKHQGFRGESILHRWHVRLNGLLFPEVGKGYIYIFIMVFIFSPNMHMCCVLWVLLLYLFIVNILSSFISFTSQNEHIWQHDRCC